MHLVGFIIRKSDALPLEQVTALRLTFTSGVSLSRSEKGTKFKKNTNVLRRQKFASFSEYCIYP